MKPGDEKILVDEQSAKSVGEIRGTLSYVDDTGQRQHWNSGGRHAMLTLVGETREDGATRAEVMQVGDMGVSHISAQASVLLILRNGDLARALAEVMRQDYRGVLTSICKAVTLYDRYYTQEGGWPDANEGDHQQGDAGAQGAAGQPDGADARDAGPRPPPLREGSEEG